MRKKKLLEEPLELELLEKELKREKHKRKYALVMKSTVYTLITVAAVAVLIATLWLPVLQIYGSSMTPHLADGDIVVSTVGKQFKQGDIIAFYYNNKVLIKRVIAKSGDWVNIAENGDVYVNDVLLDEPYVSEKSIGECDVEMPYQVPEGKWFVLGDHRSVSVDSRNAAVGCIGTEQVVGKIMFRVWPLKYIGPIE
ncbi:MAG: signal peptidase I [Clostridia bacterium]|nr:signal peptidase I [Clostridia bacterium]